LQLLKIFPPEALVRQWFIWTNFSPANATNAQSTFLPTILAGIDLFIGNLLHATGTYFATHAFTVSINRDRFEALYHRCRCWDDAAMNMKSPIAAFQLIVDDAIVKLTDRGKDTAAIKTKPTPTTGFKIWVIADDGYALAWLWH
ncbi:pep1, partial [Colletotrichum incanum]